MLLSHLVNHGHSFKNAKDLFNLLASFPLQRRSSFHLFQPQRDILTWPKADKGKSKLKQLSLLKFDIKTKKVTGERHSGISIPMNYCLDCNEGLKLVSRGRSKRNVKSSPVDKKNGKFTCSLYILHCCALNRYSFCKIAKQDAMLHILESTFDFLSTKEDLIHDDRGFNQDMRSFQERKQKDIDDFIGRSKKRVDSHWNQY